MNKKKIFNYPKEVFDYASECFSIKTLSFNMELVKLFEDDFLPRYNKISIELLCRKLYKYPILLLKVFRKESKINNDNFYSYPLPVSNLIVGNYYNISFLHFDAFNELFKSIEVTIITEDEYLKRQLNLNAIERAKKQIISFEFVNYD